MCAFFMETSANVHVYVDYWGFSDQIGTCSSHQYI